MKVIVSSWLRLAMVRRSESETDNVVILVVDRMDLGMAEKKSLIIEYEKSQHPDSMVEAPERHTRPKERLKFAIPNYNVP